MNKQPSKSTALTLKYTAQTVSEDTALYICTNTIMKCSTLYIQRSQYRNAFTLHMNETEMAAGIPTIKMHTGLNFTAPW